MASIGTKINLAQFIMKKMLKILSEKEKEAKSKRKKTSKSLFAVPLRDSHYALCKILRDFAT